MKMISVADFRYDEGLRIRKKTIVPCITARLGASGGFAGMPLILEYELDKKQTMIKEMLESGRLLPYMFIDHTFIKYRYNECVNKKRIKLQNATNTKIAPTIKTHIENYGMVVYE